MVVPMMRPDVFGALASHAGDALFEVCYAAEFREKARMLRDDFEGSCDVLLRAPRARPRRSASRRFGARSRTTATRPATRPIPSGPARRCCRSRPRPARLIDDVWQQWLALDPVRMAPRHADALRSMRRIYLDSGKADEYYLDLGATAFSSELEQARRRAHAGALRRQARRDRLALPRRRPRAGAGPVMTGLKPENATSPADYLRQIDEPRRSDVEAVDRSIREEAPRFERHLVSGMLGYGSFHYRSRSGREGDRFVIGLASQKR